MTASEYQRQMVPFAMELANRISLRLEHHNSLTSLEIEDIEQELLTYVLERATQFDPAKGSIEDFVTQMMRTAAASGAELIDDLFFTLLLSNPNNFFSAGNNNYLSGADTAFGPNSLTTAKTTFPKQKAGPGTKAKDQKPINIRPEYLVVPVELETDAELLMGSSQLMIDASGSPTKIPVDTAS